MHVLVLGSDERYRVIIEYLSNKYCVESIGFDEYKHGSLDNISKYDMIILPMNGLNTFKLNEYTIKKIRDDCIIYTGIKPMELDGKKVISFMDDDTINLENNKICVDGIMDNIKDKLKNNICILGYGCIGKMLYEKLKDKYNVVLGVNKVPTNNEDFFFTNNFQHLSYNLIHSDLIINTVPENIISEDIIPNISGYILDIASYPYGIDQELLKKYSINYYLYSSIPAKYDAKRAGKILLKKF